MDVLPGAPGPSFAAFVTMPIEVTTTTHPAQMFRSCGEIFRENIRFGFPTSSGYPWAVLSFAAMHSTLLKVRLIVPAGIGIASIRVRRVTVFP